MKKFTICLIALSAIIAVAADVAICGSNYGKHEIDQITSKVLKSKDVTCSHENIGNFPEYAKYKDSKLLIVASEAKRKFTAEEMTQFQQWLTAGGTALFICRAANSLAPAKSWTWCGMTPVYRFQYDAQMPDKDNPIVKDIKFTPFKDILGVRVTPPAKVIIGSGDVALIAESSIGKGKLYLMANEYFRMNSKKWNHPFKDEYLRIIRNIVTLSTAK